MKRLLILALLAVAVPVAPAQIAYPDFSSIAGLTLLNNAAQSGNFLRLTPNMQSQTGAAWAGPIPVTAGFDFLFTFRMSALVGGGADGMTFVVHGDPRGANAIGTNGGPMAYSAGASAPPGTAIANSLVIEFDTFTNNHADGSSDLGNNEISVHTGGMGDNDHSENFSIGRVAPTTDLNNGQIHTARIRYLPGQLEIFLNDLQNPILTIAYDLVTGGTYTLTGMPAPGLFLPANGAMYVGFTASTGGSAENHDVLSWAQAPYQFQQNSPAASLTINGLADPGVFAPITRSVAVNSLDTFDFATTNANQPWDLAFVLNAPPVGSSSGGLSTPGLQSFNLPITNPGLTWLFGGGLPDLLTTSFPGTSLTLPVFSPQALQLSAQMVIVDPTNLDGIALSHAISWTVLPCSYSESFETLTPGFFIYPVGWRGGPPPNAPWARGMGTTPLAGTGPLAGAFAGNYYLYVNTLSVGSILNSVLDTCIFDTSVLTASTLSFRLSRLGPSVGTLNVYQGDGTGTFPTLLASYVGAEPMGQDWTLETLPLTTTSSSVQFRFEYLTAGQGGDVAIDDFQLQ